MIAINQKLPNATLNQLTADGMVHHQTQQLFAGKKVVLFAVPGAFTPTCSEEHLPSFIVFADQIKAKGVDLIACISTNDAFVMKHWADTLNAQELMMLSDGDASFTKKLGLELDTGAFGGIRSKRYAMILDNGVVTHLQVEADTGMKVSSAEAILANL
ncbi:MAG: peroxiredoxin [Enterovibrio sp.]